MHLLLTDRLTCPRCGPRFGLILLADRMRDRRILDGVLGCPNCRDRYPVRDGFGDLRAPPRDALDPGRAGAPGKIDEDETDRLTALLGVAEGPGTLALLGATARHAAGLMERVPGVEVVAMDADLSSWPEVPRVSRMVARPGIPFFDGTLRGAAVDGALGVTWIAEAARAVSRLARVVVVEADEDTPGILEGAGLQLLAAEAGTVVAVKS